MVDVRQAFDGARWAIRNGAWDEASAEFAVEEFNSALVEFEHAAWRRGFDFGADVAGADAVRLAAQHALLALGKDRADGVIDLGALGRWYPATADGRPERVTRSLDP